ncbi:hypothetical protein EYC84_010402 [Monilinia fructicola]|uniref:Uncharacterized protein n=1 Tax=Monilinia fructicola TaxID=38448 RepID=A0A5M9JDP0_MONFR|nr:hypothetical protein EYC84_010402 [Monilinia fructicola]
MGELFGCWLEANRADTVATELLRIRNILSPITSPSSPNPSSDYETQTAILRHVEQTSCLLRDLYDLFPICRPRVPLLTYHLTVILPCLQKSLRDMLVFLRCEDFEPRMQWMLMHERLRPRGESLYLLFHSNLILSPHNRIFLKPRDGIGREKIFDDHAQPLSQTCLKHRRDSKCFGPSMNEVKLGISPHSKILFKLPFDKNRLSIILYLDDMNFDSPRFLCRWMDLYNDPHCSSYGVHELCIRRRGSALCFKRWSEYREHPTIWIALFFKTWQRMVLSSIRSLHFKARSQLTNLIPRDDYIIAGERKLFQGQIADDGFCHTLFVYEDHQNHTLRLHAAVADGELKKCPIWTAFVTDLQATSGTWLARHSRHRVWVKDLHIYVFCDEYRRRAQVRKNGKFELYFVHGVDADAFIELFNPIDSDSDSGSEPEPERAIEDAPKPEPPGEHYLPFYRSFDFYSSSSSTSSYPYPQPPYHLPPPHKILTSMQWGIPKCRGRRDEVYDIAIAIRYVTLRDRGRDVTRPGENLHWLFVLFCFVFWLSFSLGFIREWMDDGAIWIYVCMMDDVWIGRPAGWLLGFCEFEMR